MMIAVASRWCQGKDENHGAWMIYCGMQRKSTILKDLMDSMEIMTILKEATGRDLMRTWYDVSALYPPIQEEMKIWKNMAWGPNDVIHMWWDKMTITMGWHFSRRPGLEETWGQCDARTILYTERDLMSAWCQFDVVCRCAMCDVMCVVMTILNTERDLMSASRLGKLNLLFDSTPILRLKVVTSGSEYFWDLDVKLLTMVTDLLKTWTSSSLSWNMVSGLCSNVSLTYLHQVPHYCCHLTGTSGSR